MMPRWPHCASGRRGEAQYQAVRAEGDRLAAEVERLRPQPSRALVLRCRVGHEAAHTVAWPLLADAHGLRYTEGLGLLWMPATCTGAARAGQGGRPWSPSSHGSY